MTKHHHFKPWILSLMKSWIFFTLAGYVPLMPLLRNREVTISGQRTEEWNVSVTCAFIASSGPFQLIQQNRMNICANYTFQHKEPNSEKKKNLVPSMASVHFRKYNYKWFIHSWGRASMSVVRVTCPAGPDEPNPKTSTGMGLTCTHSCLPPPNTSCIEARAVWLSWNAQYRTTLKNWY